MAEEKKKIIQKWTGAVVSDKMAKTIVVKIDRRVMHPKYKKAYTVSKKYKVHDEKNQFKVGDKVIFVCSKKFSKDKKWQVLY
ncbi:MAG: 30S ribosomal protein S17 [bacterium]